MPAQILHVQPSQGGANLHATITNFNQEKFSLNTTGLHSRNTQSQMNSSQNTKRQSYGAMVKTPSQDLLHLGGFQTQPVPTPTTMEGKRFTSGLIQAAELFKKKQERMLVNAGTPSMQVNHQNNFLYTYAPPEKAHLMQINRLETSHNHSKFNINP